MEWKGREYYPASFPLQFARANDKRYTNKSEVEYLSSSVISAQIIACQNQISELDREIQKVSQQITKQHAAMEIYKTKTVAFLLATDKMSVKTKTIINYLPVAVLSKRYEEKANHDFSDEHNSNCKDKLETTALHLRTEISENETLRESLRGQLVSANAKLGGLNSEYGQAVAQEQQAQQKQNQNKK